jgi:hypothetical protein
LPTAGIIAAIPAKNEAADIGPCLSALAAQRGAALDAVVLCLNNCTDDTAQIVAATAPTLPFPVQILDIRLPPGRACAGEARRLAMDRAAALAGPTGVVLTTDADGRAAPDWLARNLAAIRAGADAVAGQADIDPAGAALIPSHLHAIDARECAYAAMLDEIVSLIDPDPADPWPRHDEHSGASIAVTVQAYRSCGGMPPITLAEDRAFFDALRRVDARIRHEPGVRVVVSARLEGRAQGGMADTIRQRIETVHSHVDDRMEGVAATVRRARIRAALRRAWQAGSPPPPGLARVLGTTLDHVTGARWFGEAWARIEAESPVLVRRPIPLADLPRQTSRAARLRNWLRGVSFAAGPACIDLAEAAD